MKIVATNKKAYHDYQIEDKLEAGLVLVGTEVKSLREGRLNLKDSYMLLRNGEGYLLNCHISPYSHGNMMNHEPERERKLLLKKREIDKLTIKVDQKGYSLIPLKIYFKGPYAKVEIGVARGKRAYEKRHAIKEKEANREIQRAIKDHR